MSTTQVSQPKVDLKATSSNETISKPKATAGDQAMYQGMMALITSIGRSEEVGASLADLSKTLYDTVVVNGTKKVQELQDELEFLNVFLEGYEDYQAYTKWEDRLTYVKNRMAELEKNHWSEINNPILYPWGGVNRFYNEYQGLKRELAATENNPPGLPEKFKDKKGEFLELSRTYTRKSSARAYVNGVTQQLSSENQTVSTNKLIPDSLQSQVKTMVLEQGVLVGQMMSFVRIIQRQLQHG